MQGCPDRNSTLRPGHVVAHTALCSPPCHPDPARSKAAPVSMCHRDAPIVRRNQGRSESVRQRTYQKLISEQHPQHRQHFPLAVHVLVGGAGPWQGRCWSGVSHRQRHQCDQCGEGSPKSLTGATIQGPLRWRAAQRHSAGTMVRQTSAPEDRD